MNKLTMAALATLVVSSVIYNSIISKAKNEQWDDEVRNAESEMNSKDNA